MSKHWNAHSVFARAIALTITPVCADALYSAPAAAQAAQPVNVGCLTSTGVWAPWFTAAGVWQCAGNLPVAGLAGTISNATSGQATSSTNLGVVSYNYGFNGATWDQLQVDTSKNLKVTGGVAQGSTTSGQIGSLIQAAVTTAPATYTTGQTSPISLDTAGNTRVVIQGGTPITTSASGTTGATGATLAAVSNKTTYICGFSVRANASAAATGTVAVSGTITGTMNFLQWTAPAASGIGLVEETFTPCVPASAANTTITITSAAPGTGGLVTVSAWGYQQ